MDLVEPPLCHNSIVLIGRNSRGNWVAKEQNGLFGGLFVSRLAAVRYALFENGHHPEAIIATAGSLELELDLVTAPAPLDHAALGGPAARPRRAA